MTGSEVKRPLWDETTASPRLENGASPHPAPSGPKRQVEQDGLTECWTRKLGELRYPRRTSLLASHLTLVGRYFCEKGQKQHG